MTKRSDRVLQFKVTLNDTKPPIWRRIQVPGDCTFWDLHVAIQDAMGWHDTHLHEFEVFNRRKRCVENIGIPDDDFPSLRKILTGWEVPVARYFSSTNPKGSYVYDFGDDWRHTILLEKSLRPDPATEYPVCIAGRRNCPSEDCGGTWGYREFLSAIADSTHPEHASMLEWTGGSFDPEDFDPAEVEFDDPQVRLKLMLSFR
jgi:hypothetical protein